MKRTITVSMDTQTCSSPLKTLNANDAKKFRNTEKPETMDREENENGIPSDSKTFRPKTALPAGLAESFRAVFAAFLWHEGLVYDAMACSSYLKFHPSLPKRNALIFTNDAAKTETVHLSKYELELIFILKWFRCSIMFLSFEFLIGSNARGKDTQLKWLMLAIT